MALSLIPIVPSNGYAFQILGDGAATTLVVDLYSYIAADKSISLKVPVGVYDVAADSGTAPSVSFEGTQAVLTWATALAANTRQLVTIYPEFAG